MSRFWILLLLAGCAGETVRTPAPAPADAVEVSSAQALESRRAFESAIVGQRLAGDGVEVTVAENGLLIGRRFGQPFAGTWEFRKGVFCHSLSGEAVKRASDRRCLRAAVDGRTVHLVPTEDPRDRGFWR